MLSCLLHLINKYKASSYSNIVFQKYIKLWRKKKEFKILLREIVHTLAQYQLIRLNAIKKVCLHSFLALK